MHCSMMKQVPRCARDDNMHDDCMQDDGMRDDGMRYDSMKRCGPRTEARKRWRGPASAQSSPYVSSSRLGCARAGLRASPFCA